MFAQAYIIISVILNKEIIRIMIEINEIFYKYIIL